MVTKEQQEEYERNGCLVVRGLFSAVHGFIMLERAGTFGVPISTDASFRWLIRQCTSSLAHGRRRKSGRRHAAPARP